MSSTTIEERLIAWLNARAAEMDMPTVMLDYASGSDSISFQSLNAEKVLKEYINGSRMLQLSFRLSITFRGADTSSVPSLDAIAGLVSLASQLHKGERVDESTVITSVRTSTPSLLWRSEEGDTAYGVTINIEYKEE